jgi:hypothetical protein
MTSYQILYEAAKDIIQKDPDLKNDYDDHLAHDSNSAKDLDDLFLNFVRHSQNRSQGGAINLYKLNNPKGNPKLVAAVENVIKSHHYTPSDYLSLYQEFAKDPTVGIDLNAANLKSEKSVRYFGFAKTCVGIHKYIFNYQDLNDFCSNHQFSGKYGNDIKIVQSTVKNIYNVSTALALDFYKEQSCLDDYGRKLLCKPDTHMLDVFRQLSGQSNLTEKGVVQEMDKLYQDFQKDPLFVKGHEPYYLDKMIFVIGEKRGGTGKNTLVSQAKANGFVWQLL